MVQNGGKISDEPIAKSKIHTNFGITGIKPMNNGDVSLPTKATPPSRQLEEEQESPKKKLINSLKLKNMPGGIAPPFLGYSNGFGEGPTPGGLNARPKQTSFFIQEDQQESFRDNRQGFSTARGAKEPRSLNSSFDYVDTNMNEALKAVGDPTITGRGRAFFVKKYKEDQHSSGDESVFEKQLKMPNVQTNKAEYQREVGLNIDPDLNVHPTCKTDERLDSVQEARQILPVPSFYKIVKKDRIAIIEDYYDRWPMLGFRKQLMQFRVYCQRGAQKVVQHPIFETASISVIVVNSMFLAMSDPTATVNPAYQDVADMIFQYLYTVEMVFKIVSMGFILNEGSYIRDAWNILDFTIIGSGYLGMIMAGKGANLQVLRSFRVIRPLRSISSIQGLKIIVSSLMNAIPLLRDALLVLVLFHLIFAIAGTQLFTGALKNRCFYIETGILNPIERYCGGAQMCGPGQFCGKSNDNPNNGSLNFDNVFFSLLQVFQTITMNGYTSNFILIEQVVGTWIIVYFYIIVFIGAFFLLNLLLAVIKAEFTAAMEEKKEQAKPKKKKLDDAPASSEDEEEKAVLLQEKIDHIRKSKQMSPRSKDNLINKIKIEHMLWRVDLAIDKQDVEHRIVERTHAALEYDSPTKGASNGPPSNQVTPGDRIGILQPSQKQLSFAAPKGLNKAKMQTPINYSDVFYSDKRTVLHIGKSPRENLKDIFAMDMARANNTMQKPNLQFEAPIQEDDEEDRTGLLDNDVNRAEALRLRQQRRQMNGGPTISQHRGPALADSKLSMTQSDMKKPFGMSKWLGKVFEAKKEDISGGGQGESKSLKFAGITNNQSRQVGVPLREQALRNPQDYDERVKKQVYENITRNFDIFEFLDDNQSKGIDGQTHNPHAEADDELSDELEFQIDEDDLVFNTTEGKKKSGLIDGGVLDLDDIEDLRGMSADQSNKPLKRGSTQATAAENGLIKNNSSEVDQRYVSPFMLQLNPGNTNRALKEAQKQRRMRVAAKLTKMKPIVYKGRQQGFLNILTGCKKIKALNTGKNFKEEYILLKKRARSTEAKKLFTLSNNRDDIQEKYQSFKQMGNDAPEFEEKQKTVSVRAKSIEHKRKRLLNESVKFQKRVDIMRKRRAQFFAPGIKVLDLTRTQLVEDYDEYIMRKLKIKINPKLMDELRIKKKVLYRPTSSKAILRNKDRVQWDAYFPLKGEFHMMPEKVAKIQEDSMQLLDSQRSMFLDNQYEDIVEKAVRMEEGKERYLHYENVPDMEDILYTRELKIMVKMTNHEYTSIHDIFEKSGPGRYMSDRDRLLLEKEQKKREALKMKLAKRIPGRELIIGYQKKIFVQERQFHEELLKNEFVESDEDQIGMLGRIETEFNEDHRSHIFVTGTISLTVNKPNADSKIMNRTYHNNIKIINKIKEIQKQERDEQMELISQLSVSSKRSKKVVPVLDSKLGSSTANPLEGSAWNKIQKMNFSGGASGMSMMRMIKGSKFAMSVKRQSSLGESMSVVKGGANKMPSKPEPQTDKQIIKKLNNEVQKSQIFKILNIRKLPDKIIRRDIVDKNLFRKKKKNHDAKQDEAQITIEDESADDHTETPAEAMRRQRRVDYFLERTIEGDFHISLARDAAFKRHKDIIEWSGQDIIPRFDPYKARLAVASLDSIRVWPYSLHGLVKRARVLLKWFMNTPVVEHGMTCFVLGNTLVLSLDYYGAPQGLQDFNQSANAFFTVAFGIEMAMRMTAIGLEKWLADKMNYMDGTIVILSLVELIFLSGLKAMGALRSLRILRVFRILRVAKLLRGLKMMHLLIRVIGKAAMSFFYLGMLLFLFIFIYALIGMQLFGGKFMDPSVAGTIQYNYDNFNQAFVTSFIMLTTSNWNTILMVSFSSNVSQALIAVYLVSDIFVGTWMLLNLFLAILLDSFASVEEEDIMTEEKKAKIKQKMLEDLRMKEGEDFIEGMDELQKEGFVLKSEKKKKKKKKRSGQEAVKAPPKPVSNMLEESQEIDLQELVRRDNELLEQRKLLFRGVDCEKSLYLFKKDNWIRLLCYKTIHHGKFETVIMTFIIMSSLKLVFDTYTENVPPDSIIIVLSDKFDLILQLCFTVELCIKNIAFGFVMDDGSYLDEGWNRLDGVIVTTGLLDTFMTGVDIPFLKVLRLLRILRPLRFLSHSSSMKTLIEALITSVPAIANVGLVIVIIFLMFAILAMNLFAGKMFSCSVVSEQITSIDQCYQARGVWSDYTQNMDNVPVAMITLYDQSNGEDWPDVMYAATDIAGFEQAMILGNSPMNAYFFIFFVCIGNFFLVNLFVGVLFLNFEKSQRDEQEAMLLDGDEIKWVDMMKMICGEKPEIIKIPKNPLRKWCYDFTHDEGRFAAYIMACIILNIFTMAAIFEGMSDNYDNVLEKVNYFFTASFTIEAVLKIVANGFNYFSVGWNRFDFFVVSASFLDIIMANMSANTLSVIKVGPQIARIMRVMRVTRLLRLLNKYKGLQALMQTINFSLGPVMNAFALMGLVYFIYSVLGWFFFRNIISGLMLDPIYMNFTNFYQSLILMIRCSTGEDWNYIMWDTMNTSDTCIPNYNCGTAWAPVYFLSYGIIMQYTMVNMFILIILQQFDLYYLPDDNVLDRFKNDLNNYKVVWRKFSHEFEGFKIRGTDINKFFKEVKGDLGMSNEKDPRAIERELVIMNIQADDDGFIYFNELLYKTMKRRYAPGRTRKRMLFEMELTTLEKLEVIMNEQILASRKKERQKAVAVNPFLAMMYKNMSFNVWRMIYETNLPKRTHQIELGLEREISDEEEEEDTGPQYEYQTDEDQLIDEYSKEYIEHLAQMEAEKADPFGEGNGVGHPLGRFSGPNYYNQLNQEDDQNFVAAKINGIHV